MGVISENRKPKLSRWDGAKRRQVRIDTQEGFARSLVELSDPSVPLEQRQATYIDSDSPEALGACLGGF